MPSLAGHPEHGHKALPTVVLLPGAAWLHDADRGLPGGGGARAEHGHAGGERGPWGSPGLREHAAAAELLVPKAGL